MFDADRGVPVVARHLESTAAVTFLGQTATCGNSMSNFPADATHRLQLFTRCLRNTRAEAARLLSNVNRLDDLVNDG